jgi:hypothetical protein
MGKNNKPILSVLVDEEKKEKFAELARRSKYSMAWLLNDCIDRMLVADSIHIYSDSIGTSVGVSLETLTAISRVDIEDIVKAYVSSCADISSVGVNDIEIVIQPLNRSIEDLRSELAEVSKFARSLQGEIERVKGRLEANMTADKASCDDKSSSSEPIKKTEVVATSDSPAPEANNDWDEALAKLVETGMRSAGIAQELTEMGYTNAKGGVVDRKNVEGRLNRLPKLKELYRNPRPE